MDDYYSILNLSYNATNNNIKITYEQMINEFCNKPFLTENDKNQIKLIKKAYFILSNDEYKKIYDINLNLKKTLPSQLYQPNIINKKANISNSDISDRIFSLNKPTNYNYSIDSEFLRPQNVGLSSDLKVERTKENNNIVPFEEETL
jgi:DnaJ-class molecular chaperone